ncbi:solute carrier family 22 member 5-like isoform X2 [Aricia agestis]|uniref:solute carrier family 22 member 5-like isoform X2 n=1 Tax=Aricia agestis TaxID=91739 RepID=UPI001C205E1C|nr:solute carrier family 22 member 5-like isoform X2 [Aricia agestis]
MVCKVAPKLEYSPRRNDGQDGAVHEVVDYETALDSAGGVASAFFWGIVADVFGRRNMLSSTLLVDSAILLGQSCISDFRLLLAARSLDGFLIGATSTLVFSYLSDLVGEKKRQFYLDLVGMSFVAAWLILPALAWLIIPFNVGSTKWLPIHSWRLYLALGSIPGFIAGVWVMFLPESPRLLSDTNRGDMAVKIMERIYKSNNGDTTEFKVKKIIPDNIFVSKTQNGEENKTKALFISVLKDLKLFVSKAYAMKSSLILFVFFANMAAGFGLNLWIPELLLRMQGKECMQHSQTNTPFNATLAWRERVPKTYGVDARLEVGQYNETLEAHDGTKVPCDQIIDDSVFTSGLIVGACCVVGNIVCAVCARGGARGVRLAAVLCALACALACVCLAISACACARAPLAVAAAALLNAASLNGNVLLIRLILHALPAKLSGLGVCWGAFWGRAGGVASNLAVGTLLDFSCQAPFISVAALLALSIIAIVMIKLEETKTVDDEKMEVEVQEKPAALERYISTHM